MDTNLSPIDPAELMAGMPDPDSVRALEATLLAMPQVDMEAQHLVHGRMYARTILIPAGTLLTGALSNMDNICVMHGDITVTTHEGPMRLTGFHVLPARAGYKRAGVTHADTWWTTLIHTDLTDVAAIEDEFTDESGMLGSRRAQLAHEHTPQIEDQA